MEIQEFSCTFECQYDDKQCQLATVYLGSAN